MCAGTNKKTPFYQPWFYFFGQQKPEGYKRAYYDNTNHPLPKEMSEVKAIKLFPRQYKSYEHLPLNFVLRHKIAFTSINLISMLQYLLFWTSVSPLWQTSVSKYRWSCILLVHVLRCFPNTRTGFINFICH